MVPSAALPNPTEPTIVAFAAALGALAGGTIARALRYDADESMRWAFEGSFYGSWIALVGYVIANIVEVAVR